MSETTISSDMTSEGHADVLEPEKEASCVSPSRFIDSCSSSLSSLSLSTPSFPTDHHGISSSSSSLSSVVCLTPPLPPSVELSSVMTETKLTLDVYPGGAAVLPLLWGSIPDRLRGLQYLRLGSDDKAGLDDAVDVLPNLTKLRSLAIRGMFEI